MRIKNIVIASSLLILSAPMITSADEDVQALVVDNGSGMGTTRDHALNMASEKAADQAGRGLANATNAPANNNGGVGRQ